MTSFKDASGVQTDTGKIELIILGEQDFEPASTEYLACYWTNTATGVVMKSYLCTFTVSAVGTDDYITIYTPEETTINNADTYKVSVSLYNQAED